MTKRTLLPVLVVALCALAACGGGDEDTANENTAKKAIADSMVEQKGDQMMGLERKEADCISGGMVDDIGVDKLKEYGFLTADLKVDETVENLKMSTKDSETLVDSMFSCSDVMATVKKSFTDRLSGDDPQMKTCVDDAITEDAVRGMLVGVFSGKGEEASNELVGPLMKCAAGSQGVPQE